MYNVGAKDHIVSLFFQGNHTRSAVDFECRAQGAADQNRDRSCLSVCLASVYPPITIQVDRPLQLDVGLVSEAHLRRHELTDEPSGAPHLIDCRIAKIE